MTADTQELKKAAALFAVDYVQDGMLLGLGTGSTAEFALHEIALRVSKGLRITAVPTSERTAHLAHQLGIPLTTLDDHPRLDLTIDGADEILLPSLIAIKGLGGALLREKIVALASHTVIFIIDQTKVVDRLGENTPVPVEVVPFGWTSASAALQELGCLPVRRTLTTPSLIQSLPSNEVKDPKSGHPFAKRTDHQNPEPYITDSGNYLLDCKFPSIQDPYALARSIKAITGVLEHGIFPGIASRLIVATKDGIRLYEL